MAEAEALKVSSPQDLMEYLTLANVYFLKFSAERVLGDEPNSFEIQIEPYHVVGEERIDYLFVVNCEPKTDNGETVATVTVSAIATFDVDTRVAPADIPVDIVEWFGGNVALFAAYPYLREAVQSHAARLGMPNITLDLLKRDAPLPEGLSIAARPGGPE